MNVRADERRREARELEVHANALDGIAHDPRVIERELELPVEHVGYGDQRGVCSIGSTGDIAHLAQHREVGNRHHVHPRVAPRIAVGAELAQHPRAVDTGLLAELSARRLVERLGGALEAAGNRPHPLERRHASTYEQQLKPAVGHGQDHYVHRHRERRELRWVVVRRDPCVSCFGRHDSYCTS